MSINPVAGIGSGTNAQLAEQSPHGPPRPSSGREIKGSAQPDPGTLSKQEIRIPQSVSESSEMPQDAVEVHRDNETAEIVIRYLDRSGNVILQVPSPQVINVARSIDMDFQRQAEDRTGKGGTPAAGGRGENHGH